MIWYRHPIFKTSFKGNATTPVYIFYGNNCANLWCVKCTIASEGARESHGRIDRPQYVPECPPTRYICRTTNQVTLARTYTVEMERTHKALLYQACHIPAALTVFSISLPKMKLLLFRRQKTTAANKKKKKKKREPSGSQKRYLSCRCICINRCHFFFLICTRGKRCLVDSLRRNTGTGETRTRLPGCRHHSGIHESHQVEESNIMQQEEVTGCFAVRQLNSLFSLEELG